MPKYNLALLCRNSEQRDALCKISQNLAEIAPSIYTLGVNSRPHVTVCFFEAEEGDLSKIWDKVKDIEVNFTTQLTRFYTSLNQRPEGYNYVGLAVLRSQELFDFHKRIVETIDSASLRGEVGVLYHPHFTLGANDLSSQPNLAPIIQQSSVLSNEEFPVRLVLGKFGIGGTLEDIIFE